MCVCVCAVITKHPGKTIWLKQNEAHSGLSARPRAVYLTALPGFGKGYPEAGKPGETGKQHLLGEWSCAEAEEDN